METRRRRLSAAAVLLALAAGAHAHDSWFAPAESPRGETRLELSTGNRYPLQEFNPGAASLVASGCIDAQGAAQPLRAQGDLPRALRLHSPAPALACWLEMKAYDIELEPRLVGVYLAEIRPPQATREAWAALQAQGQPWRERYRKYARVELAASAEATSAQRAAARAPRGLGLELVVLGDAPLVTGAVLELQLLRDGAPVAGQAVELVSERSRLGLWRETDAEGKVRQALPFGGRWLARTTQLGLPQGEPPTWHSRFATLAIELR